ncbi:hypothetical protein PHET_01520 [Paragonimus heterotremus]|uniref:Uncharacterized protein n=1 Tax=Paragonimus heterotremus TaxID=100268 RepID=A0A8J4THL6_9TREM|nr:hypothetical protein PHET_01520 [Paragonimus heterotremus]
MLGFVTIEVHGTDMDGASRHAQRLANNFLDDLDSMQRASRARDRRAMSHFDSGLHSSSVFTEPNTAWYRRPRSLSTMSVRSSYLPPSTMGTTSSSGYFSYYSRRPHYAGPVVRRRVITHPSPPVMVVGKSVYPTQSYWDAYPVYRYPVYGSNLRSTEVYPNPAYTTDRIWYDRFLNDPNVQLPTSSLRAHPPPPRRHILTPRAEDYLRYRYHPWRRAYSLADLYDEVEEAITPRVVHTVTRRTPLRSSRLGSVPPVPSVTSSYRPVYYTSEVGLPPVVPRTHYYRTNRYITETPYYLTSYSGRIAEPSRPILTNHYTTAPAPITQRYTYYYPSVITKRSSSYTNLSPEVQYERRRIERRMDDLLDYKLPPPEYYREMRGSLRNLHDKLDEHRRLLDRYSGIEMNTAPSSVQDRIESKYQQLASRNPDLPSYRSYGPSLQTSKLETGLYYNSPQTITGYGPGLVKPEGSQVSELRGRIKRLLCRARRDPHYYRFLPVGV